MKCKSNRLSFVLTLFVLSACGGKYSSQVVEAIPSEELALSEKDASLELDQGLPGSPGLEASRPESDAEKPLALIYQGPGSCSLDQGDAGESGYGCSEAAADVAVKAGFQYKFVGPNALPQNPTAAQVAAVFKNAKVWMQPGGVAVTAFLAMSSGLRSEIVKFVSGGGGYVGFCAGAFMATARIGQTSYSGFGIFPGSTAPYSYSSVREDVDYAFLATTWNGKKRAIFFEGGPYLYGQGPSAEATATFSTGYVVSARAAFGKGRVYLTGGHPEAPRIWAEEDGLADSDGLDLDLGADMVQWAAGQAK